MDDFNEGESQEPLLKVRLSTIEEFDTSAPISARSTSHPYKDECMTPIPVSLTFKQVRYKAGSGKQERTILSGISGHVRSGEMLAILGPSGAGKSTLLDILAQRAKSGAVSGEVQLNGRAIDKGVFRRVSAYVQQEDMLQSYLTVEESIYYAAYLRTPPSTKKKDLLARTHRVMQTLGIDHVKNSKIGSEVVRGISGGEKKRCAIAMELVSSPSLLFLDEPTTGLDTFTALHLLNILKGLASTGVAVVFSIHQPRSSIFRLFDKVLLLNGNGEEAFFGPAEEAMPFFASLGVVPEFSDNPADFLIDSVSVMPRDELTLPTQKEEEEEEEDEIDTEDANECENPNLVAKWAREAQMTRARSRIIAAEFSNGRLSTVEQNIVALNNEYQLNSGLPEALTSSYCRNIFIQICIVATRAFLNKIRDPIATIVTIIVAIFFALLIGSVYFQLGYTQGSIQNRMGVLFFIMMNTTFSSLSNLTMFMADRAVFVREHRNGMYSAAAYYIGKVVQSLPISLVVNLAFDMIVYFMVGLQVCWQKAMIFYLVCTLVMLNSYSLCLFISSLAKNMQVANVIGPLIFVLLLLPSGGILISLDSLPFMWRWLKYVSFVRYGLSVLVVNEFDGLHFECSDSLPICITNGTIYAESLGYHMKDMWNNIAVVAGSFGVYLVLGYLALLLLRTGEGK